MRLVPANKGLSPIVPHNKGVNSVASCQLSDKSKVKDVPNSSAYFYCDKLEGTYWTLSGNLFLSWNDVLGGKTGLRGS